MAKKFHDVILPNGLTGRMNDAALRIAERHFGVIRSRPATKEIPIEIKNLPKRIDIIKAKPEEAPKIEPLPKVENIVPVVEEKKIVKKTAKKK